MTQTPPPGAHGRFGDAPDPDRRSTSPAGSFGEARTEVRAQTQHELPPDSGFGAGLDGRSGVASEVAEEAEETSPGTGTGESRSGDRRRSRRRPSGGRSSGDAGGSAPPEDDDPPERDPPERDSAEAESAEDEGTERPRRRRGSRGGRRRKKSGATAASASTGRAREGDAAVAEEPGEAAEPTTGTSGEAEERTATGEEGAERERSRRKRSRRKRKKTPQGAQVDRPAEDGAPEEESAGAPSEDDARERDDGARRKRRRGSRGGRKRKKRDGGAVDIEAIPGEEDDELPGLEDGRRGEEPSGAEQGGEAPAKGGRKRKRSKKERTVAAKEAPEAEEQRRDQVILVNAADPEEVRVAVAQDGRIVDLQMNVRRHESYVNDIYRGRVVNLEEAIGAAFIDFGQGRNGFLHASDVMGVYGDADWKLQKLLTHRLPDEELADGKDLDIDEPDADEDGGKKGGSRRKKGRSSQHRAARRRSRPRLPIGDLLKKGSPVVVQVTKDAIGDKGPTLTTYFSIPGRYLVLMPSLARTGVSRKIEDEKERRRLKRILQSLDIPEGMGVIVRTAGVSKTKTELSRDLDYLLAAWETFCKRLPAGRNPMPLYEESDVAIRTMRDLFSSRTERVVVDDPAVYDRMVSFTNVLMPEHVERIHLHEGPRPLFHTLGVEQDFEKIFAHRVELPSGGSIIIDQTEALVAIDVNSGRTRDEGADFEDIALKTNLEAVPEIVRQMRLRDLGGIIVLDFIDMARMSARRQVEKALREALSTDRARSKLGRISQFGLLEMTRQRLGPGLSTLLYDTCWRCRGSGRQRTAQSRAQAILRRLGSALMLKGFTTVEVCAHPEVVDHLQRECHAQIRELRERSGRDLRFKSVPDQVEDSVLHYLRADGREVRPGGRRKK